MIQIRAPGRICLFGEHQDYLGYPVIAMSISKYIYLKAEKIIQPKFIISLPDINETLEIPLNRKEVEYKSKRDYIRSGYNHFLRKGNLFKNGYKVEITGDIPINSGVASSSALVIAWLFFLNIITGNKLSLFELAIEGFNTEVKEFKEGGGMMDHFCSTFGNLIHLKPNLPEPKLITYNLNLEGFILGNSLERKKTVDDLVRVKTNSIQAFREIKEIMPRFNPFKSSLEDLKSFLPQLKLESQKKIIGNIINRDITIKAKNLIEANLNALNNKKNPKLITKFYQDLGNLLNLHHYQLRENIQISTSKIDKIISKCLESGALGCKINGSGFGGTLFALSLGNEELIKNIIKANGGESYPINTSTGVKTY
ncbi:MAG: mevalonate kinase [Promethearchaeota archaeon]